MGSRASKVLMASGRVEDLLRFAGNNCTSSHDSSNSNSSIDSNNSITSNN